MWIKSFKFTHSLDAQGSSGSNRWDDIVDLTFVYFAKNRGWNSGRDSLVVKYLTEVQDNYQ